MGHKGKDYFPSCCHTRAVRQAGICYCSGKIIVPSSIYFLFPHLPYLRNMNTGMYNSGTSWQTQEVEITEELTQELHNLIVWNDDVNTFDWVITSLVDICGHDSL